MSRELKFRVWDAGNKLMYQPALKLIAGNYNEGLKPNKALPSPSPAKNWTWMQYTGLKDANDIEIYEGDILAFPFGLKTAYQVKFGEWDNGEMYENYDGGAAGWYMENRTNTRDIDTDCEVIGNIYENKDLLK